MIVVSSLRRDDHEPCNSCGDDSIVTIKVSPYKQLTTVSRFCEHCSLRLIANIANVLAP